MQYTDTQTYRHSGGLDTALLIKGARQTEGEGKVPDWVGLTEGLGKGRRRRGRTVAFECMLLQEIFTAFLHVHYK